METSQFSNKCPTKSFPKQPDSLDTSIAPDVQSYANKNTVKLRGIHADAKPTTVLRQLSQMGRQFLKWHIRRHVVKLQHVADMRVFVVLLLHLRR